MQAKLRQKIHMRLSNQKSADKFFKIMKRGTQKIFHAHYIQVDYEGNDDFQFKIIEQCTTNTELTKREIYWQHRLKVFFPNDLNDCEESCLS